jgi:hypothetical protein
MFILKNQEQLSKAIERAKAHHPQVKFVRFGEYLVRGTAGNFYRVLCLRLRGEKAVSCECPAGTFGDECFHSAAALSLHVGLAAQRGH